jgi:uncharacterized membrane protein
MTATRVTKERRLDSWVAWVLAAGVVASGTLIAAGLLGSAVVGWSGSLTGQTLAPSDPTDFGNLWPRLLALQPLALSQAGLLLLIATPVVRVAVTALGFFGEHDRLYAAISTVVLVMLLAGFVIGALAGSAPT